MNTGETIALIKAFGNGGGGGSSLPSVTSADNGKVLGVVNGAWAAQGDITVSASTYDSYLVELTGETPTLAELQALYKSGRKLILDFGLNMKIALDASAEAGTYTVFMGESVRLTFPDMEYDGTSKVIAMFYDDDGVLGYHIYLIPNNKFVVTLTPTALDYSGTMDKTVAEINAAYEAGMEIWFKVLTGATSYVEVPASFVGRNTSYGYSNFGAEIVQYGTNTMIVAVTGDTSDGTKQTYSTTVYALTPAS